MVEPSNQDGWNKLAQLPVGLWGSLSGLYSNRHEDGLNMGPCGSFSLKFTSSCLVSVCRALRKRAVLSLSDSKSREREKIGNICVESLARYLRTPEFRIQLRFIGKQQALTNSSSELKNLTSTTVCY